jgi:multidrug transporter EmrE-like cation transporter
MSGITLTTIITFLISMAFQVAGILLLPASKGFTNPLPAAGVVASFGVALWMLARITASGVNLGLLIPISAACVPLFTMAAGVLFFGEPGNPLRVALLAGACVIIGVAGRVG